MKIKPEQLLLYAVTDRHWLKQGELLDEPVKKALAGGVTFLQIRENEIRLVALDGHRIAIRRITLDRVYEDREAIIPGKTMTEIGRILTGEMHAHSDIKEYAPNGRYFSRVQSGMPGAPATSWECMGT